MKRIPERIYTIALTVVITCALTFMTASAYYTGKLIIKPAGGAKMNVVSGVIDRYFFGDYDEEKATDKAIKAYVDALGDPHTVYMDRNELLKFAESMSGAYYGIGVLMTNNTENDTVTILEVFENSPASDAGFEPGDIISKVNGKAYKGSQLDEITEDIQGEAGTDLVVTVVKKSTGNEEEHTLTRRQIHVDTVASEVMEGNVGYIVISQFATETGKEFTKHLDVLIEKGVKGLIIDVRDNPGGTTDALESVMARLLPKDKVIYYTMDKDGKKNIIKSNGVDVTDLPLVVLSNGSSASASEILIGSVKDHERGTIVGEKSYGKGSVQTLIPLSDETALKVTVEKYFTPNGDYIHEKGIAPHYEVVLTAEDTKDTQLEKALEILK